MDDTRRPLALFDSGVGGLSVAREIRRALPSEDLLYVADTAYCPYGDRPDGEVRARALVEEGHLDDGALDRRLEELTRPLREARVDAVVLGCTHYAFVAPALARVLGPGVELVDSAPAIARRAEHLLREGGLLASVGSG